MSPRGLVGLSGMGLSVFDMHGFIVIAWQHLALCLRRRSCTVPFLRIVESDERQNVLHALAELSRAIFEQERTRDACCPHVMSAIPCDSAVALPLCTCDTGGRPTVLL